MQHSSSPTAPRSSARRTLLALSAAAAFGGFAATGMQLMLDRPAAAEHAPPATAATAP